MVVQNQTSPVDTTAASTPPSTATQSAGGGLSTLANESTFLQLLVSQIKNQDPLNPTDGTQFLSQLTQLSQLEQMTAIRQAIEKQTALSQAGDASTAPSTTATN